MPRNLGESQRQCNRRYASSCTCSTAAQRCLEHILHATQQHSTASNHPCVSQAQQEVRAIQLSEAGVKKGEQVQLCGLTQELRLMRRSSRVTSASHALKAGVPSVPRFRPVHEEVIATDSSSTRPLLRFAPGHVCTVPRIKDGMLHFCCRASWKNIKAVLGVQHALPLLSVLPSCVHEA